MSDLWRRICAYFTSDPGVTWVYSKIIESEHETNDDCICGPRTEQTAVLDRAHRLLSELYDPAGVLIYWSSRIKYLDNQRPCDLWRDRNIDALTEMCDRLDAFAAGAFL